MSSPWFALFLRCVLPLMALSCAALLPGEVLAAPGDIIEATPPLSRDQHLVIAATKGDLEAVKLQISQGADINSRHEHGTTPLMAAVQSRNSAVVHYLLEQGAETDVRDDNGTPLLFHIVYYDDPNLMLDFLQHGADPNMVSHRLSTPLMQAAAENKLDLVKLLLAYGANCTIRDIYGNIALHYALIKEREQIARLLTLCTPAEVTP